MTDTLFIYIAGVSVVVCVYFTWGEVFSKGREHHGVRWTFGHSVAIMRVKNPRH